MERLSKYSIIFLLTFIFWGNKAFSRKVIVAKNTTVNTISKGVSIAENGDTIIVKYGVYYEVNTKVNKRVCIIGENYPIIDGKDKNEMLIVEHDWAKVIGLKFRNSGSSGFNDIAALRIENCQNFEIRNNRFENNFFAIQCMNTKHGLIINNQIISGQNKKKAAANGIHCWKGSYLKIIGNTVKGHRDGIYFEFITNSQITKNKSIDNKRYGLHFMFSHDDTYTNNQLINNGAGVAVMYSKRVKMYKNIFSKNWGNASYGLLLKEIKDSHIENNTFLENTSAIFSEGSNQITMVNNQFIKNGWAIKIQSNCYEVKINKNNFIGNTFDVASNGELNLNNFDNNYWDKYEGFDLNKNGTGDVPYRPITFYSLIIERNPGALMLFRSFFVKLMDKAESALPSIIPENLKDNKPHMKKFEKQL